VSARGATSCGAALLLGGE